MGIGARIEDGEGSGTEAGVLPGSHALKVSIVNSSASEISTEELTQQKQFRGFLADTGTSTDLNIDGSSTPVEFSIASAIGFTRWITGVRLLLNDTNLEIDTNDFRQFGSAAVSPGLTNGVELFTIQGGVQTDFFRNPVKSIGQFLDYADDFTNLVNSVSAQSDFLSFDFDFDVPVVLPPGTTDKIVVRINDDLTNLELFNGLVRGYQEAH